MTKSNDYSEALSIISILWSYKPAAKQLSVTDKQRPRGRKSQLAHSHHECHAVLVLVGYRYVGLRDAQLIRYRFVVSLEDDVRTASTLYGKVVPDSSFLRQS